MIKPWPIIESTSGPDMGLFKVTINRCRSPRTGHEHHFYVIDFPDWVQILPLTPDNKVVMIRQYRHGCDRVFLELPGGLIDTNDSSPKESARRELLEETGYCAQKLVPLNKIYPQPAVMNHCGITYLAQGVERVSDINLDATEDIEVCLVELAEIPEMIRRGEINHGQTVMALSVYFLLSK